MTAIKDMSFTDISKLINNLQKENHSLKLRVKRLQKARYRRDVLIEAVTGKSYGEWRSLR
jgi:hypothetical protein